MIGLGLGATHASPLQAATAPAFDTKAFSFDGTSTILGAPAGVDIFNGSGGSISFWVKGESGLENRTFIAKYPSSGGSTDNYTFGFASSIPIFAFKSSSGNGQFLAGQASSIGSGYHHFVISIDDSSTSNFLANTKIYQNGSDLGKYLGGAGNSAGSTDLDNGGLLFFGRSTNTANVAVSEINEIAFFDTRLTSDHVTAIYNSGVPFDLTSNDGDYDASSNLQLYLRGEESPIGAIGTGFAFTDSTGNHTILGGNSIIDSTL
jgi:hypothetical protein